MTFVKEALFFLSCHAKDASLNIICDRQKFDSLIENFTKGNKVYEMYNTR